MHFVNFSKHGDGGFDNAIRFKSIERVKKEGRLRGTDPFDGKPCEFIYAGGDFRESLVSSVSRSIQRQRTLVAGLSKYLFNEPNRTLAECCTYINLHRLRLFTAEANSAIFEFLKIHIEPELFYYSEYFGQEYRPGDKVCGIPHEDLQQLSFTDHFFDIVFTSEVLEHVPDALAAEKEIIRVLKPGGVYIFTVPYMPNASHDIVRAVIENGQVKHIVEPQYHGDPLRPNEGILVFRIFCERELKERFTDLGASFATYNVFDQSLGIISFDAFVHVVIKGLNDNKISNDLTFNQNTQEVKAQNSAIYIYERNLKTTSSRQYKSFIFVHIPKSGGTSFRDYIYRLATASGVPVEKIHVPGYGGLSNEKNISQLTKQELVDFRRMNKVVLAAHCKYDVHKDFKLNMADPFYYILLRNPVERFISHYNFFHRHLGYRNLKGIHLNDLNEYNLEEMLKRMANIQLSHLINGLNFFKSRQSGWERLQRYGKNFVRTISSGKFFPALPIGINADESWLEEAERLLEEEYGAFGVLEKMDLSLAYLKMCLPHWLHFSELQFPQLNERIKLPDDELVEERILESIRKYNYFDIRLYDLAVKLLEKKTKSVSLKKERTPKIL